MIRKHFRLKRIALGLAFAAVAVPTAQASPTVLLDGHAAPVSYTAVPHQPISSEISVQSVSQLHVEGLRWQAMAKAYEGPGITAAGAALANASHSALPVSNQVSKTTGSGGFNWNDAGIGASVSFAAALLLLTAVGFGRRYRSRTLASV